MVGSPKIKEQQVLISLSRSTILRLCPVVYSAFPLAMIFRTLSWHQITSASLKDTPSKQKTISAASHQGCWKRTEGKENLAKKKKNLARSKRKINLKHIGKSLRDTAQANLNCFSVEYNGSFPQSSSLFYAFLLSPELSNLKSWSLFFQFPHLLYFLLSEGVMSHIWDLSESTIEECCLLWMVLPRICIGQIPH